MERRHDIYLALIRGARMKLTDRVNLSALWILGISIALLACFPAHATDATVRCVAPTAYTDNSAIPAGKTVTYTLYGALTGVPKQKLTTSTTCSFLRSNLAVGVQEWYVTATIDGVESAASTVASLTIAPSTPQPPTSVTATTATAFEYKPSTNTFAAVGLVAAGKPCGPESKSVAGKTYCRVALADSDLVVWPANRSLTDVWVAR